MERLCKETLVLWWIRTFFFLLLKTDFFYIAKAKARVKAQTSSWNRFPKVIGLFMYHFYAYYCTSELTRWRPYRALFPLQYASSYLLFVSQSDTVKSQRLIAGCEIRDTHTLNSGCQSLPLDIILSLRSPLSFVIFPNLRIKMSNWILVNLSHGKSPSHFHYIHRAVPLPRITLPRCLLKAVCHASPNAYKKKLFPKKRICHLIDASEDMKKERNEIRLWRRNGLTRIE